MKKLGAVIKNPLPYCAAGILLAMSERVRSEIEIGLFLLVVPILLYAFVAYVRKDETPVISETEIGNNCYLIGFVFTLTVITISLMTVDSERLLIEELIRDQLLETIGIALGTSVVGMVLRVGFHSAGTDVSPETYLEKVNTQARMLEQVFVDLNKSTNMAKGELNSYSDTLRDETRKLLEEFRKSQTSLTKVIDEKFNKSIESTFSVIKQDLDESLTKPLEASRGIIQDTFSEFRNMMSEAQKVRAGLGSLNQSLTANADSIEKVSKVLTDVMAGIADFNRNMEQMSIQVQAYGTTAESVKMASSEIEAVLKEHVQAVRKIEDQLREQYVSTKRTAEEQAVKLLKTLTAMAEEAKRQA